MVEEVTLPLPAETARQRMLVHLHINGLEDVSADAFDSGHEMLLRAGVVGLSKQVLVQVLPPYLDVETMVVPLRWVATGPTGALFPQLDANLELTPATESESTLQLVGSYRPPLGEVGAGLDRVVLHRVAQSTCRSLLREVRSALLEPLPAYQAELELNLPRRQ